MSGMAVDIISWVLIVGGGFFVVVGGIGVLRLPDYYTRLHAAGLTDTLGAGLIMGGLMVQAGLTLVTVKLAFILLFLLLIGPTATHALAKAALFSGVRPMIGKRSSGDEVADGDSTPNEASGRPPSS